VKNSQMCEKPKRTIGGKGDVTGAWGGEGGGGGKGMRPGEGLGGIRAERGGWLPKVGTWARNANKTRRGGKEKTKFRAKKSAKGRAEKKRGGLVKLWWGRSRLVKTWFPMG